MKMAKYILSLGAMICTATAFGSFQYDFSNETFKTNDAGYLEILQNSVLNISYNSPGSKFGQVSSFGYFTLDSQGNILSSQELSVKPNTTVSTVELKSGDKVGFWLKSGKNNPTLYSVSALNQNGTNYFNDSLSKDGSVLFSFGNQKWDSKVLSFHIAYTNFNHTGQPLPGILATLLLGGGALAFSRMKRAKTKS
ncbi:MAG: hypothetical protein BWY31_03737 [Lentisphaerae bacterium ADurb.Bin242]|nr:MAG: hypothetical protein BWY31_03737 [Lentisphaerae bacterium ADurb.Bin242]